MAVALVALGVWLSQRGPERPRYVTAQVTEGPVVRVITASGTVNPVITVQVGTYVSGVIQDLHCDFNTKVKAGQLCAKIDPRPYQVVVDQATANLASAEAQLRKDEASLAYAKVNYERDQSLLKQGIVSQDAVDIDRTTYEQAAAQVHLDQALIREREAALRAATVNLNYTNIISPVDGIVVSRNVNVGQTVAASFQTPTLFLIAQDLTKMQVDTNVSESDVGGAKVGQPATFTVEAFPNRVYRGAVAEVRQAPITVQNVVTYDVVVTVDNSDLSLLPGMTANTRIIAAERDNVLRVPVQALRFAPSAGRAERKGGSKSDRGASGERENRVWIQKDGALAPVPVTIGLDDGAFAEIVRGDLHPGDEVVLNEVKAGAPKSTQQSTPSRPRFGF